MAGKFNEPFDLEAIYDAEIAPLMTKIIDICKTHGMPMVASFEYANDGNGGEDLCTSLIPRGEWLPPEFERFVKSIRRPTGGLFAITVTEGERDAD
jgi:hypothetical protein